MECDRIGQNCAVLVLGAWQECQMFMFGARRSYGRVVFVSLPHTLVCVTQDSLNRFALLDYTINDISFRNALDDTFLFSMLPCSTLALSLMGRH